MSTTLPSLLVDEHSLDNVDPKGVAKRVEEAREGGYMSLTPYQRQFAMEFVLSGSTLRKIARLMDVPLPFVRRMYNDPVVRAYIADLQKEVAAHRLINDAWVENQIMLNMPKLLGEEPVDIVTSKGTHVKRKKYHGAELVSLFKHFGGGQESKQAGAGGVNVQINFGDIINPPNVTLNLGDDDENK